MFLALNFLLYFAFLLISLFYQDDVFFKSYNFMRSFSSLLAMSYLILALGFLNYGLKLVNILSHVREIVSFKHESEMNLMQHVGPPPDFKNQTQSKDSSSSQTSLNLPQRFRNSTLERANLHQMENEMDVIDYIHNRMLIISVVFSVIFLGMAFYNFAFSWGMVESYYPDSLNPIQWDAILQIATELLP